MFDAEVSGRLTPATVADFNKVSLFNLDVTQEDAGPFFKAVIE